MRGRDVLSRRKRPLIRVKRKAGNQREDLSSDYADYTDSKPIFQKYKGISSVVDQFGVREIDCLTEPSAVAPDARVKLRTKQVAHHTPSFQRDASVNWMNFSAGAH